MRDAHNSCGFGEFNVNPYWEKEEVPYIIYLRTIELPAPTGNESRVEQIRSLPLDSEMSQLD